MKFLNLEYFLPNVGGLVRRYITLEDFWKVACSLNQRLRKYYRSKTINIKTNDKNRLTNR